MQLIQRLRSILFRCNKPNQLVEQIFSHNFLKIFVYWPYSLESKRGTLSLRLTLCFSAIYYKRNIFLLRFLWIYIIWCCWHYCCHCVYWFVMVCNGMLDWLLDGLARSKLSCLLIIWSCFKSSCCWICCCIGFRVGIALEVVAVTFDALVSVAEEVRVRGSSCCAQGSS